MKGTAMKPGIRSKPALLFALLAVSLSFQARAAGNVEAGKDVFATECAECHSVREGKNKKGPTLFAIVGRKAVPGAK